MPLSWNEIKTRALQFSHEWSEESSEDAEAKSFWDAFFNVFGVPRRRVATFETHVKKIDGKSGYIDLLWKGILLIEHKSRGQDLTRAYTQAKDYFPGIKDRDLPRYILVSDFENFHLYDLETGEEHRFKLKDLHQNVRLFGFVAGYQSTSFKEQDPVNIKAALRMGLLHDKLKAVGYDGHPLEVYLVRILFCLFAEDSGVFDRRQFQDFIEQRTAEDGSDLAGWLQQLFETLNKPETARFTNLDEQLKAFRYVNGALFAEQLPGASFDSEMREILLECCGLDWSRISPAIFGAMFQSIMDKKLRRNLGAHYTSEKNIMKVIGPLFLDDLKAEFETVKTNTRKLEDFHKKIASLKFLDPACGCGNFLIIAYRELRELELEILRILLPKKYGQERLLDITPEILCNVDQFYGIEIEEFPAQIAQTALWLIDHQMNIRIGEEFGQYFSRLPLKATAKIVHGNALRIDWRDVVKPEELNYILGNPPFIGYAYQSSENKSDMALVFTKIQGAGVLDFVTAWYWKAAQYMADNPVIECAFVSTNSISQGEQVGILWSHLIRLKMHINFAHKTFQWSNEARGLAAVHCVIIGFSVKIRNNKKIFEYETPRSEAHEILAENINPYLVDAPTILLEKRKWQVSGYPLLSKGSQATDGGNLLLNQDEKKSLIQAYPLVENYIRPFLGGEEFINDIPRFCLWLADADPALLRSCPPILERLEKVRKMRESSSKAATVQWATRPSLFTENRQPKAAYLMIPRVSSELRKYIPIGFFSAEVIASEQTFTLPDATVFHFGVMSSSMHMAWVSYTCGRMKSDFRYSNTIVYNNFPWPEDIPDKQKQAIETCAQDVLDARAVHPDASLADLYDPNTMPPNLVKAHRALDAAVDAAYSKKKFTGDADRVAFLFEMYQKLVSPMEALNAPKTKRKKL
jgi:hypothetical protein